MELPGRCGLVAINEPEGACPDLCGFWECNWIHEVFGNIPIPCGFWGLSGGAGKRKQP